MLRSSVLVSNVQKQRGHSHLRPRSRQRLSLQLPLSPSSRPRGCSRAGARLCAPSRVALDSCAGPARPALLSVPTARLARQLLPPAHDPAQLGPPPPLRHARRPIRQALGAGDPRAGVPVCAPLESRRRVSEISGARCNCGLGDACEGANVSRGLRARACARTRVRVPVRVVLRARMRMFARTRVGAIMRLNAWRACA